MDLPARLIDMGGPNTPPFGGFSPNGPAGSNGAGVPSAAGVPTNPSGRLGGVGPEFTNYFGDNGNITTLNHNIYCYEPTRT
jgi:tyrosinase